MDRPLDRRLPAEVTVADAGPPDAHAAGRNDDEAERAVVDLDHVDPVATRREGPFVTVAGGRPRDVSGQASWLTVQVLIDVGDRPGFLGHGWSPGFAWGLVEDGLHRG